MVMPRTPCQPTPRHHMMQASMRARCSPRCATPNKTRHSWIHLVTQPRSGGLWPRTRDSPPHTMRSDVRTHRLPHTMRSSARTTLDVDLILITRLDHRHLSSQCILSGGRTKCPSQRRSSTVHRTSQLIRQTITWIRTGSMDARVTIMVTTSLELKSYFGGDRHSRRRARAEYLSTRCGICEATA